MIKNIIFDVGEVLLSYRWNDALAMAGETKESADILGPKLFNSSLWKELDLGIRPYFEVVEDMCNAYPGHEDSIRRFLTEVEKMPIDRPRVWELVHQLREKGYKLYILSNYSEYMFTIHTKDKPFIADMDGCMVSYMVNINKPAEGIYRALLQKYHLNADECFYFDDRAANTEAAQKLGIRACTVTSEQQLIGELERFLK